MSRQLIISYYIYIVYKIMTLLLNCPQVVLRCESDLNKSKTYNFPQQFLYFFGHKIWLHIEAIKDQEIKSEVKWRSVYRAHISGLLSFQSPVEYKHPRSSLLLASMLKSPAGVTAPSFSLDAASYVLKLIEVFLLLKDFCWGLLCKLLLLLFRPAKCCRSLLW